MKTIGKHISAVLLAHIAFSDASEIADDKHSRKKIIAGSSCSSELLDTKDDAVSLLQMPGFQQLHAGSLPFRSNAPELQQDFATLRRSYTSSSDPMMQAAENPNLAMLQRLQENEDPYIGSPRMQAGASMWPAQMFNEPPIGLEDPRYQQFREEAVPSFQQPRSLSFADLGSDPESKSRWAAQSENDVLKTELKTAVEQRDRALKVSEESIAAFTVLKRQRDRILTEVEDLLQQEKQNSIDGQHLQSAGLQALEQEVKEQEVKEESQNSIQVVAGYKDTETKTEPLADTHENHSDLQSAASRVHNVLAGKLKSLSPKAHACTHWLLSSIVGVALLSGFA